MARLPGVLLIVAGSALAGVAPAPGAVPRAHGTVALARRFPEAGAEFNLALLLQPDMPEALYGLGLALDGLGRLDDAVDAYNRALRLNLDYVDIHFNLARILAAQGKTDQAIAHYEVVLKARPDDAEARTALVRLRVGKR